MTTIKTFNASEKTELRKINDSVAKFKEISLSKISENQRTHLTEEAMLSYLTAKLFSERIKAKETKSKNRDNWKDNSFFFKRYLLEDVSKEAFFASLGRINCLLSEEEALSSQIIGENKELMLEHLSKVASIMYDLLKTRNVHDQLAARKRYQRSQRHTMQVRLR